ncbi:uncharacterized protein LOC109508340 isoform X2 [Hippocampus comes]|uniref:uncharacterized protein LOC109508340 isoform X2 n=1 Tax=Hippocampus comes TaxID=109280 RepID=UPI00094E1D4D|nr:PREDICTED: uncharacterized protein LOC109508340 isoform X2 [Hippocampus comes]
MPPAVVVRELSAAALLVLLGTWFEAAASGECSLSYVMRANVTSTQRYVTLCDAARANVLAVLPPSQQVAYQGEAVTLSSGGDPSRELASIKWYVFSNQTWIATFHGGKINTERFYLFRGRLTLNASSGDLTIRNVSRRDAVDFSVELVDTEKRSVERVVTLVVRRHLQIPSIRTLFSVHLDGGCWVGLDCLSPDLDANLSWTLEPPLPTAYAMADPSGKGGVLLASLASRDTAHFTCTSSRKPENVSDSIRVACVTATEPRPRRRHSLFVLAGIVSGGLLVSVTLAGLTGVGKGSPDIAAARRHRHPPLSHRQADQEDGRGVKKEDDG